MRKQTVKLNRKTIFYSLFGLLLVLVFVKYALQTNIPEMIFLGIVAAIACFGTKDEIIAVSVACIPFHSAFSPYWAVLACIAIYILKFYRDINISRRIVAVLLLIIWELLHCFNNIFDLRLFVCDFVPYLLCVLLMWCDASKFDYKFIVRSFAVAVLSTGAMLVGKIGFRVGFRLESILLNLQRLGLDSEEMEIAGAEINPNTFGILCVLAACGLFQILMTEEKKFSDILLIIALFTIGSFTISKTFLALTALLVLLLIFAQKGSFKKKIQLIFGLAALAAVAFLMLQLIFPRVLDLFLYRFTHYDLTTGRDGLFIQYSKFILSDFKNLFYGIGLNDLGNKSIIYYDIADVVSHNGIQEIVLAWGIPGLILYGIFTFDLIASSRKVNPCQKLINYIPAILIFTKIQAGQLITSGYTLLTLSLCYLSLCHNFYPDEAEQKGFKKLN